MRNARVSYFLIFQILGEFIDEKNQKAKNLQIFIVCHIAYDLCRPSAEWMRSKKTDTGHTAAA
jgi:hypothetical protein